MVVVQASKLNLPNPSLSSPHITSLLFDVHSLSLALMHFDSSLSTLLFPFSHSRDLRLFLVVSWLCSSDTWVWFCGCAPAGCGSDFVGFCWLWYEFELYGGQIRAWGLARWCRCRFGRGSWVTMLRWFRSVHGSDWFMVRRVFFFLPWIVADLVHGFFLVVGYGSCVFFVWLWLVVADWEVVEKEGCWVMATVVCGCGWWGNGGGDFVEARWPKQNANTDGALINHGSKRNPDLNWKSYGDSGMGLCWIFWVFFCVYFPRKFLGLGLLEISLFFFFEFMGLICCRIRCWLC